MKETTLGVQARNKNLFPCVNTERKPRGNDERDNGELAEREGWDQDEEEEDRGRRR